MQSRVICSIPGKLQQKATLTCERELGPSTSAVTRETMELMVCHFWLIFGVRYSDRASTVPCIIITTYLDPSSLKQASVDLSMSVQRIKIAPVSPTLLFATAERTGIL